MPIGETKRDRTAVYGSKVTTRATVSLPGDPARARRLVSIAASVRDVCLAMGSEPIVTASLAGYALTGSEIFEVNDVDMACPESLHRGLSVELTRRGFQCDLRVWHVLQVRAEDLKVDVDSLEVWHAGELEAPEYYEIAGERFAIDTVANLIELYRRGLSSSDPLQVARCQQKLDVLRQREQRSALPES